MLNVKELNDIALLNKSSQSCKASFAIGDHSVTCHPTRVNPTKQAGNEFTYAGGMEG